MDLPEDQAFDLVRRHLLRSRGIDLAGYSRPFIMRGIRKTMARSGAKDYADYLRLLRQNEEETTKLLCALSINVTEFFRDKPAFESFSVRAIRPLLEEKCSARGGMLRIWSAGCATGQEAYTLGICVAQEMTKMRVEKPMTMVVGTDISAKALERARKGFFTPEQVQGLSELMLRTYFEKAEGGYLVSEKIRKGVRFARHNLLDDPTTKHFDAIVCRNVVIYFSRPMHERVMTNLHEALRPGGYLMLGRTETLMGTYRKKFETVDSENRIFRKGAWTARPESH